MKVYEKMMELLKKYSDQNGIPTQDLEVPSPVEFSLSRQARLLLIAKVFQTCDAASVVAALQNETDEFINRLNEIALNASDDTYYNDLIRVNKGKYNA